MIQKNGEAFHTASSYRKELGSLDPHFFICQIIAQMTVKGLALVLRHW